MMYEVIILAPEYSHYVTNKLDHYNNHVFEFKQLGEATNFAEICWDNGKDTVIRKKVANAEEQGAIKILGGFQSDS